MRCVTLATLLSLLLAGIMAMPLCPEQDEGENCKQQRSFTKVDCVERLKFKHPNASCFMNDKDEFIIMSVNDRKLSKRSIASEDKAFASLYGDRVIIRRIRRSVDGEEDFKAEVLSAKELKDLVKEPTATNTESPATTNEVLPGTATTTTNAVDNSDNEPAIGIIFVITTAVEVGRNNDVTDSQETSLSGTGEEDMAEALFGLLLLGAIMEEVKKHQIETAEEHASEEA